MIIYWSIWMDVIHTMFEESIIDNLFVGRR